jgi:hypothetical protein
VHSCADANATTITILRRGVPREFLDCARASQLEEDGLEEVQVHEVEHQPGSGANGSSTGKASSSAARAGVVVIEVD